MALATLADLKAHLGIPTADTSQDARLTAILAGVEVWLIQTAAANGRALKLEEDRVDLVDGGGSPRLFLPRRPVVAVTSIKVDGAGTPTWDDITLVPASSYRVYPDMGLVKRLAGDWPQGHQNVQVTYDVGYGVPPANLTLGVLALAAYFATQAGKEGLASERIGNYSYSLQVLDQVPGLSLLLERYLCGPAAV